MHNTEGLKRAVTFSRGITKLPYLEELLDLDDVTLRYMWWQFERPDVVLGWGGKSKTIKAREYARRHDLPYYALEDGFLRSIGLGKQGHPGISLVVDPEGIYYDARRSSALENLLNSDDDPFTPEVMDVAEQAMQLIVRHHLTKYNGAPDAPAALFNSGKRNILVVDQVAGDLSLTYGLPAGFDLAQVITEAKAENCEAKIYIKLHPETVAGLRAGCFTAFKTDPSVQFITDDLNPLSVLKHMDKVYVATSLMGFEALMLDKPVVCFGMPFYAGWGLTDDRVQCARRKRQRSVREVFAAAYMLYSRYVNPATGKRCDIIEALRFLIRELHFERVNQGEFFCFGIRHWKRCNVLPYLKSNHNRVVFVKTVAEAKRAGLKQGSRVVVWGTREPTGLDELLRISGKPLTRMEDGFLRSVGLGSDLVRPSSLVLDEDGIYFDPARPSALERLLETRQFSSEVIERAARLRNRIIHLRLSKYNTEPHAALNIRSTKGRKIILVPGQVESDASIRLGCAGIRTNMGLLGDVRRRHPEAYIIFKPHPDIVSGNRKGKVSGNIVGELCDQVVESISITACLEAVDEVHTMTSLVGFEALLRGLPVVVYGLPFYAGWGLTEDIVPIRRRRRRLTLDELVAGTLLLYPRYYDWRVGCWADCEGAIDRLVQERCEAELSSGLNCLQPSFAQRQLKKLGLLIKGLAHAG
jgi:capsular polysaccharide export protein